MIHLTLMDLACIGLMCLGLGAFTGMFVVGWLDEREDRYAGIVWSKKLGTSISWERLALHNYRDWEDRKRSLERANTPPTGKAQALQEWEQLIRSTHQ